MKTLATVIVGPDRRQIDLTRVSPARIPQLRQLEAEGQLRCPICSAEVSLQIGKQGPVAAERTGQKRLFHEPEDRARIEDKNELTRQLERLFPSAAIDENVYLDEANRFADIVVVKRNGGRLAIEYRSNDMRLGELTAVLSRYRQAAIQPLILLDARRLDLRRLGYGINTARIGRFELELVREQLALFYYLSGTSKLVRSEPRLLRVHIPSEINPIIASGSNRSLGKIPVAIRGYPFDRLRIQRGAWTVQSDWDPPLPGPPALSAALLAKIAKANASIAQSSSGSGEESAGA